MEIATDKNAHVDIALPVLKYAVDSSEKSEIRFAALICDIDNGNQAGLDDNSFSGLCKRHCVPNAYRELAGMALQYRTAVHRLETASAEEMLDLLNAVDAFRREQRFNDFLIVCEADARSANPSLQAYAPAALLQQARQIALAAKVDTSGLTGKAIGEKIRMARIEALEKTLVQA